MKAAVLHGKKDMKVEEVNLPPNQDRIMVKILACGICISDVKGYQQGQSHYCKPPIILGHEYVGNIVATPKMNDYFKKGDRVAVVHAVNCGYCNYCQRGLFELCENKQMSSNGGFAEYVSIDKNSANKALIKLPENLSTNEATLLEPIACCIESIEKCDIGLGNTIVIIGAGVMGLLLLQLSLLKGASKVIVSEINEFRRNMAKNLGATVLNPKEIDLKKFIKTKPEKAKKIKEELEKLDLLKLKKEHIVKITNLLPGDTSDLNKIFTDVSLNEDEISKILGVVKSNK